MSPARKIRETGDHREKGKTQTAKGVTRAFFPLIRYNPANKHIEYSNNRGSSWYCRNSGGSIGSMKSIIVYGDELILCSDKGVMYSNNKGSSWHTRNSSNKNFIDLQDAGREILATTDDGICTIPTTRAQAGTGGDRILYEVTKVKDGLEGIRCGAKVTSCPDQLARTLKLFQTDNK